MKSYYVVVYIKIQLMTLVLFQIKLLLGATGFLVASVASETEARVGTASVQPP